MKVIVTRPLRLSRLTGFTLIELVIGIITFSLVMVIITSVIAPQASRSVEPILLVRATELAQSMFNEINGKSFDENADRNGGIIRCGENGTSCTGAGLLGPEEGSRDQYDDVDDYNGLSFTAGSDFQDSVGQNITVDGDYLYDGFSLSISVFYDGDFDGTDDGVISDAKAIQISVSPPSDTAIIFTSYRSNY